jgi:hypothetical protein
LNQRDIYVRDVKVVALNEETRGTAVLASNIYSHFMSYAVHITGQWVSSVEHTALMLQVSDIKQVLDE